MTTTKTARTSEMGSADSRIVIKPTLSLIHRKSDLDQPRGQRITYWSEPLPSDEPMSTLMVPVSIDDTFVKYSPEMTEEALAAALVDASCTISLRMALLPLNRGTKRLSYSTWVEVCFPATHLRVQPLGIRSFTSCSIYPDGTVEDERIHYEWHVDLSGELLLELTLPTQLAHQLWTPQRRFQGQLDVKWPEGAMSLSKEWDPEEEFALLEEVGAI